MPFIAEYIPPLECETSNFAKQARIKLNTGHSQFDMWTIDRSEHMVLLRTGRGHSPEEANDEYWDFLCLQGLIRFNSTITHTSTAGNTLRLTRALGFVEDEDTIKPDEWIIDQITKALEEYKDFGVESKHSTCKLSITGI